MNKDNEKLLGYRIHFHILFNFVRGPNETTIRYGKNMKDAIESFKNDMMFRFEIDEVEPLDKDA